ncbi:MAG: serine/threonine-protein kinase [Holophagales bacterium]|nr:serine/threonine-protein kinase [Holophagales bacterium]
MQIPTWQRSRRVFEAALDRPTAERSRFVREACTADGAAFEEVRDLLARHQHASGFLEQPYAAPSRLGPLAPGYRLGAYRICRELGRGGMGAVYLAERADRSFHKQVALKVVKPGAILPELAGRLREERQILAGLEHPNIARLLDGGNTEDGRPYLVMEYVEGEPIDRYCERARSIEETVRLFRQVCAAVFFLHQNLVIHRDLKPSNILVTPEGVVKLLDFGLAEPTGRLASEPIVDAPTLRAMTPEYASPEQIRGEALTTATDVYSLGVLLYELLAKSRPYRSADMDEPWWAVLVQEPIPPSEKMLQEAQRSADGSDNVHMAARAPSSKEARRRSKRIAGDLDSIVLTAMSKQQADRYGSVDQLSDDLGRYLQLRPVMARRPSLSYRAGKFVRRHAVAVTVVSTVCSVLLLSVAMLVLQHRSLGRQRDLIALERDRAATVETFTVELLQQFDPDGGHPEYARFREHVLDAGVRRVERELRDQPRVRAAMMTTLGVAYRRMARYDKALPLLRGALALRRASFGGEHPEVAESLHELGLMWAERDRYGLAEPLFREALTMRRRLLGRQHVDVAESLNALGILESERGDRRLAEPLFQEALVLRRRLLGEDHPKVAETLRELADWAWTDGDMPRAARLWREALGIAQRTSGEVHPAVADSLESLATFERVRGDLEASEALYRKALEIRRALFGDEHPSVARALYGLAMLSQDRRDYDTAEQLLREVLTINRRHLGEQHLDVAGSLNALGRLMQAKGDFDAAERFVRRALAINRRLVGDEHRHVAITGLFLADVLFERGELAAAESVYGWSLPMARRFLGEKHFLVATGIRGSAVLLTEAGRAPEALASARQALSILEEILPDGHPQIAEARSVLGGCLASLGRFAEAEPLVTGGYRQIAAHGGPDSRAGRDAADRVVRLYTAWGSPEGADRALAGAEPEPDAS